MHTNETTFLKCLSEWVSESCRLGRDRTVHGSSEVGRVSILIVIGTYRATKTPFDVRELSSITMSLLKAILVGSFGLNFTYSIPCHIIRAYIQELEICWGPHNRRTYKNWKSWVSGWLGFPFPNKTD